MAEDIMCEKLTKSVIKYGFDRTIKDLSKKISKDSTNTKLYLYRALLHLQNANIEDADSDIEVAKNYDALDIIRAYFLKSSLIFADHIRSNPNIDYASKITNIQRAEFSCYMASCIQKDGESRSTDKSIKDLKKEIKKNNKASEKTLCNAVDDMYKLCKSNDYNNALFVCLKAIDELGEHPFLIEYKNFIEHHLKNPK